MDDKDMKIVDLIERCSGQEDPLWQEIREELIWLLRGRTRARLHPEREVREVFLELGAPDHLAGHPYAVKAVVMALQDRDKLHNLTQELYPNLAEHFGTSPISVERSIRHLVEATWARGDAAILDRYFGNIIHADRGKPTNGEFLARMTNAVKDRLHDKWLLQS